MTPGLTLFYGKHEMHLEVGLPHSSLVQRWRASKDSDFAVPTGAAGGTGSF